MRGVCLVLLGGVLLVGFVGVVSSFLFGSSVWARVVCLFVLGSCFFGFVWGVTAVVDGFLLI